MVTVSAFMDESGKFHDSEFVVIAALIAFDRSYQEGFANEWAYWLKHNGLTFLKASHVLKVGRPLSEKVVAADLPERIEALLPFVRCIRRYLQAILGVAIEVAQYKLLPEDYRQIWSNDPIYLAFTRTIMQISQESPDDGKILLYCDDEEETALPFYRLYRKVRIEYQDARDKLKGITFTDDQFSFPLQASDLVASLTRQEALFRHRQKDYGFRPLYEALVAKPAPGESIIRAGTAWCDREQLTRLGEAHKQVKSTHRVVQLRDLDRNPLSRPE